LPKSGPYRGKKSLFGKSGVTFWPSGVTLSEHPKMTLFCAQKTHYLRTKIM